MEFFQPTLSFETKNSIFLSDGDTLNLKFQAQSNAIERRLAQKIQSNESAYKRHQAEIETLHDELVDALDQIAVS